MTLNNFEKQAKEGLNKRRIQPTKRAWNEISEALVKKEAPHRLNYFWYGIAAGFIGLLIISGIYFKPAEAEIPDSQIVVNPVEKNNPEQEGIVTDQEATILKELLIKEEPVVVEQNDEMKKERFPKPQNTIAITVVNPTIEKNLIPKITPTSSERIIDTKLEQVIARVNLLEQDNSVLTDAEVDSLLRQAQKEILTEQLFREDNTVDATALLNEVEYELDQSFRDQIFEKLKTGFNKVRTAVADRNN